jgi:hypothetical protein
VRSTVPVQPIRKRRLRNSPVQHESSNAVATKSAGEFCNDQFPCSKVNLVVIAFQNCSNCGSECHTGRVPGARVPGFSTVGSATRTVEQ